MVMAACPSTETSNETDKFTMPFQGAGLPAGFAKFYMYLRDETNGLVATMTIKNPDQSTFATWTYTSTANTGKKYNGWSKKLPTVAGIYTYEISYNNTVCSSTFEMVDPNQVSVVELENEIKIFPNPSNGKFTVELANFSGKTIAIYNILGAKVMEQQITQNRTEINLNTSGVYYYEIKENNSRLNIGKIVVK